VPLTRANAPLVKWPVLADADGSTPAPAAWFEMALKSDFTPRLLSAAMPFWQIRARHVEAERVTIDMIGAPSRPGCWCRRIQGGHQFDLVMIILGQRRIRMIADRADSDVLDRHPSASEENGGSPVRDPSAALDGMGRIVAPGVQ